MLEPASVSSSPKGVAWEERSARPLPEFSLRKGVAWEERGVYDAPGVPSRNGPNVALIGDAQLSGFIEEERLYSQKKPVSMRNRSRRRKAGSSHLNSPMYTSCD